MFDVLSSKDDSMMRSHRLAVLSILVVVAVSRQSPGWADSSSQPNVVLFIADDVSDEDVGCYGHPTVKTPNIDRLAAGGLRLTNAYLTTSSCSPSRCSLITGRYPHNTGAPELHTRLPDSQIRFPELLRKNGYYTALSGKNHMFGNKDRAFDLISRGKGPGKEEDWVELVQKRPKDKPFFFWFASTDAHRSWQLNDAAPQYEAKDAVVPPYLIDSEPTKNDLAKYYHEISRFDRYVGDVVKELQSQGVLDNTLVIVMADNGRPFPRCKTRLYNDGIRTPLVLHYPKDIKQPAVSGSLVSTIDLSATILDVTETPKSPTVQGVSLVPLFQNPKTDVRDIVFAEHNWHVHKNHERMIRTQDFLYIKNNFPNQQNLCSEAYKFEAGEELWQAHAEGRTTAIQKMFFANPCPKEELYQVASDPDQLQNLAGDPQYAKVLIEMRGLLSQWTEQTGDTVPSDPTPDRDNPPRIQNGKLIPPSGKGRNFRHREMPGSAAGAEAINKPGPISVK